jgi:SPP1 gp7 family putative phage head morphogenesis protein
VSGRARTRAWLAAMAAMGARKKTPGKVPLQRRPTRIEEGFGLALARMLDPIVRQAFAPALLELRPLVERAATDRAAMLRGDRVDADFNPAARARAILEQVRRALADGVAQVDVETLARRSAAQLAAFNREQLSRQTRSALGIDVIASDARLPALADAFVEANVGLIKGLTDQVAADVERAVVAAVQDGAQWGTLATDLETRIGLPAERAQFIARDQVGKYYGQVNAARQREIGVRRFRWVCVDDERVRGKPGGKYPKAIPSHWARHDKVYSYDNPPDGELPGEAILCRCSAEPVLEDLLDDAED